jgi:UDPglucose 6-dehydrogenase
VEDAADDADALVLVTEWQDYSEVDWLALRRRMRNGVILDGRHFLDRNKLEAAGFQYLFVG